MTLLGHDEPQAKVTPRAAILLNTEQARTPED